jgi:hypothetical protein
MAIEKVIDIKVQGNADQAVGSLRSQLREAQADVAALSDKFGATSNEAINAAKRAGELKDKIGDAKALTDAFNPDAKFKALSSSLGGVAGGFAAVQGGMALFGKQSEDVEKTLLKVQSAMALSAGLQSIGESVDSFKQLGAVVKSYSIVQKALTAGQWLWNAAMAANPIGLIIAGIAALIAAGVALTNYFKSSAEASEKNATAIKNNSQALKNEIKAANDNSKALEINNNHKLAMAKASGASAAAIRKLELKLIDEQIAYANSSREIAKNTYEKNKNTLASLKANDADEEQIKSQEDLTKKALDNFGKQTQYLRDSVDKKKEIQLRQQVEVKQAETNHNTEIRDKQKEHQKELAEIRKKAHEDDLKQKEEWAKQARDKQREESYTAMDDIEAARKANEESLLTEQELATQRENEAYKIKYDNAVKNGFDTEELEIQHLNNINAINLTAQQKQYDDDKAASDAKIKITELEKKAKLEAADAVANTLSGMADLLGKETAAGKAAAVASATINTFSSAQKAYDATVGIPYVGPVLAPINAGIAIMAGIKNVKSILAVKVPGGGGGGSAPTAGGAAGAAATAPQFNMVGNTGVNQLAQTLGQEQPPIKTYVTAGDVTTGQSLNRNIITNASLG